VAISGKALCEYVLLFLGMLLLMLQVTFILPGLSFVGAPLISACYLPILLHREVFGIVLLQVWTRLVVLTHRNAIGCFLRIAHSNRKNELSCSGRDILGLWSLIIPTNLDSAYALYVEFFLFSFS
jgi:hypothetical protein